ncbi:hypothetical protein PFISCL1PPCAC_662, partial [Pristionchus fissidentatus]
AFSIFATWLAAFSISFTFLPILQILDWRKRGTADGFSSVNFVLPMLMTSCWLRHGYMTDDFNNKVINTVTLAAFTVYILCFAYYQPVRKYLYMQLMSLFTALYFTFAYVDSVESSLAADTMGGIAAAMQIVSLGGGIYEIKRAISMGTTEYIPASMQYAIFLITAQWSVFGYLANNPYIMVANLAGLAVNIATISLYFVYPPITWRVPLIGTQQEDKKKKSN